MRFYYILIILILPLYTMAQQSVPTEKWDSMVAADAISTVEQKEAAEVAEDAEDAAAAADEEEPVQEHFLWDQTSPAMADTMESYADYPLVVRGVSDTIMNVLKKDKDLQYVIKKKKETIHNNSMEKFLRGLGNLLRLFPHFIIFVVIMLFGWLLFRYLKQNGYLFRSTKEDTVKVVMEEEEVQTVDAYQQQIEQAVRDGRFRVAVRLLYLQTLQLLMDKEVLTYSREKTNAAYLRSMMSTPWYKKFAALTLNYEYIWYGEVPVNNAQFNTIHSEFRQFMNELGYTR
ncbi:hypothetical protein [Chitinophaga agri]|uniref:DUF4129 domain-containing protein n=1 Tax=Chitinophaga agri TaxID=2703787 RepID=A0A6B9ZJF7_9BACT|nr:hypothetical protein [Chitinophaga agri]QHS62508.1 hypothetical protein GWR21_23835 [Chitinophaga agri]